jgi:cullin 3
VQDRVYAKSADVPEIWEAGLDLFFKNIIKPPFNDHIIAAILKQIYIEREGYTINRSAVKECVDVLVQLGTEKGRPSVYKAQLEPALLEESEAYYAAESEHLMMTCHAAEFLQRVRSPGFNTILCMLKTFRWKAD